MNVGFIHGVMNTDNMTLSGETIDYGPCAFMGGYDPAAVFSSIDHHGRYAYGNQPDIACWNIARLAETLLPLLSDDSEQASQWPPRSSSRFRRNTVRTCCVDSARNLGCVEAIPTTTAPMLPWPTTGWAASFPASGLHFGVAGAGRCRC